MEWVIDKAHDGMMIRDYLQSVRGFSQRIIKAVKFDGGHITVNASPVTVRYRLASGDRLNVKFPPEKKVLTCCRRILTFILYLKIRIFLSLINSRECR